jgi:integrase
MEHPDTTPENPKSGKEVAKQGSRFSATYWTSKVYRPKYLQAGEYTQVSEWFVRIQHAGCREAVGLSTNNQEEASRKAAKLYSLIRTEGWSAALRKFAPERSNPQNRITVGDHIKIATSVLNVRDVSLRKYSYCLRRIALDITGQNGDHESKFDPLNKPWREKADKIKLVVLSPLAIETWKREFVTKAGTNPTEQGAARRNANYFIRNARSLFGKKVQKKFLGLNLPSFENPFNGVELEKQGSTRYISTIRADDLIEKAKKDLRKKDPDSWKVILLALGAGLRRAEIDGLRVDQLDDRSERIRVVNHEHFEAKTDESVGTVDVERFLLDEMRSGLSGVSGFVIEPETAPAKGNRAPGYYRCNSTFNRVSKWLRANGVDSDRPIHVLRKEFGSMVNAEADIFTAMSQLRHSNIATTAAFYADNRRRSTVRLGQMMRQKKSGRR